MVFRWLAKRIQRKKEGVFGKIQHDLDRFSRIYTEKISLQKKHALSRVTSKRYVESFLRNVHIGLDEEGRGKYSKSPLMFSIVWLENLLMNKERPLVFDILKDFNLVIEDRRNIEKIYVKRYGKTPGAARQLLDSIEEIRNNLRRVVEKIEDQAGASRDLARKISYDNIVGVMSDRKVFENARREYRDVKHTLFGRPQGQRLREIEEGFNSRLKLEMGKLVEETGPIVDRIVASEEAIQEMLRSTERLQELETETYETIVQDKTLKATDDERAGAALILESIRQSFAQPSLIRSAAALYICAQILTGGCISDGAIARQWQRDIDSVASTGARAVMVTGYLLVVPAFKGAVVGVATGVGSARILNVPGRTLEIAYVVGKDVIERLKVRYRIEYVDYTEHGPVYVSESGERYVIKRSDKGPVWVSDSGTAHSIPVSGKVDRSELKEGDKILTTEGSGTGEMKQALGDSVADITAKRKEAYEKGIRLRREHDAATRGYRDAQRGNAPNLPAMKVTKNRLSMERMKWTYLFQNYTDLLDWLKSGSDRMTAEIFFIKISKNLRVSRAPDFGEPSQRVFSDRETDSYEAEARRVLGLGSVEHEGPRMETRGGFDFSASMGGSATASASVGATAPTEEPVTIPEIPPEEPAETSRAEETPIQPATAERKPPGPRGDEKIAKLRKLAREAFDKKEFETALDHYREILDQEECSPSLREKIEKHAITACEGAIKAKKVFDDAERIYQDGDLTEAAKLYGIFVLDPAAKLWWPDELAVAEKRKASIEGHLNQEGHKYSEGARDVHRSVTPSSTELLNPNLAKDLETKDPAVKALEGKARQEEIEKRVADAQQRSKRLQELLKFYELLIKAGLNIDAQKVLVEIHAQIAGCGMCFNKDIAGKNAEEMADFMESKGGTDAYVGSLGGSGRAIDVEARSVQASAMLSEGNKDLKKIEKNRKLMASPNKTKADGARKENIEIIKKNIKALINFKKKVGKNRLIGNRHRLIDAMLDDFKEQAEGLFDVGAYIRSLEQVQEELPIAA